MNTDDFVPTQAVTHISVHWEDSTTMMHSYRCDSPNLDMSCQVCLRLPNSASILMVVCKCLCTAAKDIYCLDQLN